MPASAVCYVGLGSNLGPSLATLQAALVTMKGLADVRGIRVSRFYRTAPVGRQDQPWFVNAVAGFHSTLDPFALLDSLSMIEKTHGRQRSERWGPRTLDLDLLLAGDQCLDDPRLRLPHPELHRRPFVLIPLAEIAPVDLMIPGRGRLDEWVEACSHTGIELIEIPVSAVD